MKKLQKIVISTWGQKGKIWHGKLPEIIEELTKYWELSNIRPVENMSYNFVAKATQTKTPVVLKISCDNKLISNEYNALKHFNGHNSVRVLDINEALSAMLLEQAIPGNSLKQMDKEETINVFSRVATSISSLPSPDNTHYTHMSEWCEAIDRIKGNRIDIDLVEKAKTLKSTLLNSAKNEYLCHGDLHLENIIQHGEEWLAIDPKGVIGEMAFEAAAFDILTKEEIKNENSISSILLERTRRLSKSLEIEYKRLLEWFFLRSMISAQWFIEDNSDPNEMIKLSKNFYSLLT